jgi:hypothetical protein
LVPEKKNFIEIPTAMAAILDFNPYIQRLFMHSLDSIKFLAYVINNLFFGRIHLEFPIYTKNIHFEDHPIFKMFLWFQKNTFFKTFFSQGAMVKLCTA